MHDRGHERGGHGSHHAEHAGGAHETRGGAQDLLVFAGWDAALAFVALAVLVGFALVVRRSRGGLDPPAAFAFVAGTVLALFAAASPLGSLVARGSHLAFMLQLELLMNVAPPLLLLGLLPAMRPANERPARSRVGVASMLGVWLLAMYVPHLPAVHALVLGSPGAYALQLAGFAVAGTLFWSLVLGGGMGLRGKLAYLALAQVGAGLLAAFLIWYPGLVYDHQHGALPFGLSAVADQRLSGVTMMVVDMLAASTAAGWIFVRAAAGTRPARSLRPATE
jgi:cytochrome c oxidase assembly factor CtaG